VGDLYGVRDRLLDLMWDKAGIVRDRSGLEQALAGLDDLGAELAEIGVVGGTCFNHTWQDRLNIENQILVSRAVAAAALARENSRGAHYRTDHPAPGPLERSTHTVARLEGGTLSVSTRPVVFSRVRPGDTLLPEGRT
jgi:fumarate reductase flavoprotein subunit